MKSGIRARLVAEVKTMILVSLYLALLLGAFTIYRRLVLAHYHIGYFEYGCSLVEALVLAKVIVLGKALRLGERFSDRPLIVPTLYKTACFSVLVLAFAILEHLGSGWWNGKNSREVFAEMFDEGLWEILARVLVLVTASFPCSPFGRPAVLWARASSSSCFSSENQQRSSRQRWNEKLIP